MKSWRKLKLSGRMKKKTLFIWVVSYLCILMIPLIGSVMMTRALQGVFEKEISSRNVMLMEQMNKSIEASLNSIYKTAATISVDEDIRRVVKGSAATDDVLNNIKIAQKLNQYILTDYNGDNIGYIGNIENIYVYFNKREFGIGKSNFGNRDRIYADYYGDSSVTEQTWRNAMGEYRYFKYLLTEYSDGRRYIDFIYQGQEDKGINVDCSVVIRIRQPLFAATIDYYKQQNGGKIYIVSAERKVIASTEEEDELPYAVNFDGAENYMTKQKDDIVFTSYSKTSGWTIVSVVPNGIYRQKIQIIWRFAFLNVMCCLLFGVLMVIFLALKNYKPISSLVSMCENFVSSDSNFNEYEVLRETIADFIAAKSQLMSVSRRKDVVRRHKNFEMLLEGASSDIHRLHEVNQMLGTEFESPFFICVIFEIFDRDMYYPEQEIDNFKRNEEMQFIMKNILEEIFCDELGCTLIDYHSLNCVGLISVEHDCLKEWDKRVEEIIRRGKTFIRENFGFSYSAVVSALHEHVSEINQAYEEARQMLKYKAFILKNNVLFYADFQDSFHKEKVGLGQERLLKQMISVGDFENASAIVHNLLSGSEQSGNPAAMQRIATDLTGIMLSCIYEAREQQNDENLYDDYSTGIKSILRSDESDGFEVCYLGWLQEICRDKPLMPEENNAPKADTLKRKMIKEVKRFVGSELANSNLSIVMIGEHVNASPYYLSMVFKKEVGESLPNYIQRLRVEKAKALLLQTDDTIDMIVEKVGFTSKRTFMRAFSKLEGVTPGKYKTNIPKE